MVFGKPANYGRFLKLTVLCGLVEYQELGYCHQSEQEENDCIEFQLSEVYCHSHSDLLLHLCQLPRPLSEAQLAHISETAVKFHFHLLALPRLLFLWHVVFVIDRIIRLLVLSILNYFFLFTLPSITI